MKFIERQRPVVRRSVAPFAGAWIEILTPPAQEVLAVVAPFAGAWIEIKNTGLMIDDGVVAPFAGVGLSLSNGGRKRRKPWLGKIQETLGGKL